jgi:hypothetical protein
MKSKWKTIAYVALVLLCFDKTSIADTKPVFTQLSQKDISRLDEQRAIIFLKANAIYGTSALTKSKADLAVLQRLLDDHVYSNTQAYELQSMGVVLGDVFVSELPLHWMIISDEYGTDPTLRYRETDVQVNVLTMISKRIERGEKVNVFELLRETKNHLKQFDKNGFKGWRKQ